MQTEAYVYLVRCTGGKLYAGWTTDPAARLHAHKTGKGAKYTRAAGAESLAYLERCPDKSAALAPGSRTQKAVQAPKGGPVRRLSAHSRPRLSAASPADGPEIAALYNWYVQHSTATFQVTPADPESYRDWVAPPAAPPRWCWPGTRQAVCWRLPAPTPGRSGRPLPGTWRPRFTARRTPAAPALRGRCTGRCWSWCGGVATGTPMPRSQIPTPPASVFMKNGGLPVWAAPPIPPIKRGGGWGCPPGGCPCAGGRRRRRRCGRWSPPEIADLLSQ